MRNPDEFDEFYKAARHRLLLQTYALTGDLPASRGAVRDAFIAAWHHWRKVSRLDDPETWVRPYAWLHAQRRHTARIWHRDKALDPELKATLDALAKLNLGQRRTLLLTQLSAISMAQMAREAGLTDAAAEQQLQLATSQFALTREVPSTAIRVHLQALEERTSSAQFPRPSIIRRAGSARRRAHTGAGVAACAAAVLLAGSIVTQNHGAAPVLGAIRAQGPAPSPKVEAAPMLRVDDLLTRRDIASLSSTRKFSELKTGDNTTGTGINVICQQERFADPRGSALVRRFSASGKPELAALQVVEMSSTVKRAATAYDRTIGWYAGCRDKRVQLLSSYAVSNAGDDGMLMVMRAWSHPVTTYTIGVARTGQIVTQVVRRVADADTPSLKPIVHLMAVAVGSLCAHQAAGACPSQVKTRETAPPPAQMARGMLQVVDLPPVSGVTKPWVGTDPSKPTLNPAATTCDKTKFTAKSIHAEATRSFLIPQAKLPTQFGVSQTLGRFPSEKAADEFVTAVRKRMSGCEDRDLATTTRKLHEQATKRSDMTIWHITTEISDKQKVEFLMAIIRRDDVVAQIGFVPATGATIKTGDFHALADRAFDRLVNLPQK